MVGSGILTVASREFLLSPVRAVKWITYNDLQEALESKYGFDKMMAQMVYQQVSQDNYT